jgi:hypothetical protein
MLNMSFALDMGLYHGKMGVILFFARYGRYTGNSLYDDFAGELLDDIYEDIHAEVPIDFENGLCGIGWGIEYLLQNGFMEGDSDDALSEIDQKIMERDIRRMTDQSFRTGLAGISCYIQMRLGSPCRNRETSPFDELYLSEWKSVANGIVIPDEDRILCLLLENQLEDEDFLSWEMGLENGCAGYGLKCLMT